MKSFLFAVALSTVATQSQALSCLWPDVARSFNQANEAEESYVIFHGTFDFGDVPSSDTGNINAPREVEVASEFNGRFLGANGFERARPQDVTIQFTCSAAWCGSMSSEGQEVLAFVQQTDAGFSLDVNACGTNAFINPTQAQINQVLSCASGGDCTETQR